jgi:hypothetical protein
MSIASWNGQPFGDRPNIVRPVVMLLGPNRCDPWQQSAARRLEDRVGTVIVSDHTGGLGETERQLYAEWLASWMFETDIFACWLPDINPDHDPWPLLELGIAIGLSRDKVTIIGGEGPSERLETVNIMTMTTGVVLPWVHKTIEDVLAHVEVVSAERQKL